MFIMQKFHVEPCTMLLVLLVGDMLIFHDMNRWLNP